MQITGQCHCGAISMSAYVDPSRVVVCHCSDCQVLSGAPMRAMLPVPAEHVELTGSPRHYVKRTGNHKWHAHAFCSRCGTQLYACDAESPSIFNLRLGWINERDQLPPMLQIWTRSAMPWLHELDALPACDKGVHDPCRV